VNEVINRIVLPSGEMLPFADHPICMNVSISGIKVESDLNRSRAKQLVASRNVRVRAIVILFNSTSVWLVFPDVIVTYAHPPVKGNEGHFSVAFPAFFGIFAG
jgi:hypothetical protein